MVSIIILILRSEGGCAAVQMLPVSCSRGVRGEEKDHLADRHYLLKENFHQELWIDFNLLVAALWSKMLHACYPERSFLFKILINTGGPPNYFYKYQKAVREEQRNATGNMVQWSCTSLKSWLYFWLIQFLSEGIYPFWQFEFRQRWLD